MNSGKVSTATDTGHASQQSAWSSALATLAAAALLVPVALWQFGPGGAGIIALYAIAMLASLWISVRGSAACFRAGRATAGLLIGTGIRMILPLALALAVVVQRDRFLPLVSVIYMVPMYLAMLLAETYARWRELAGGTAALLPNDPNRLPQG